MLQRLDLQAEMHGASWLVVLTADCDLVHDKVDGVLTCLTVVPAISYFASNLAPKQCKSELARLLKAFVDQVYEIDVKRDRDVSRLSTEVALRWLRDRGSIGIATDLSLQDKEFQRVAHDAKRVLCLAADGTSAIERLYSFWKLNGRTAQSVQNEIKNVFLKGLGSDCFFLPVLPSGREIGLVVLLRQIVSIDPTTIYLSEYDAKSDGVVPGHFVRVGRFKDALRFAIAQRAMLVFSRIGMQSVFEDDSSEAASLVAEHIGNAFTELEAAWLETL